MQCAVLPESYSALEGMRSGKGCTMTFGDHASLQLARSRVRDANLSFGTANGGPVKVFLDAGKTRNELRPAVVTHRAYDVICDIEKSRADAGVVVKDLRGKTVLVNGTRCGYSLRNLG